MRTVNVEWRPDEQRFTASGTHPGHTITLNAPHEAGSPPTGFSPSELLLAGVGACAAWDVVEILRKGRQEVTGVDVRVTGEQRPEPPWAYERIEAQFVVRGRGIRPAFVERAVRLSCERYCSVIATLRGVAEVVSTFEVIDEASVEA